MSLILKVDLVRRRLRGMFYSLVMRRAFRLVGCNFRFFGSQAIRTGEHASFGDNCWLQAVTNYKGTHYAPELSIGRQLSCSDNVHISCAMKVTIGNGVLIGSHVYVGDHTHGGTEIGQVDLAIPPAQRPLANLGEVHVGDNVWIGDGVVILAGAFIPAGCIIAANSVVNSAFTGASVIGGAPARVLRRLE